MPGYLLFPHYRFKEPEGDGMESKRERKEIIEWRNKYLRNIKLARERDDNIVSRGVLILAIIIDF